MYAVVEIGGMQWKVRNSQIIRVPKIDQEPSSSIEFERVMLTVDKEDVQIGRPVLQGVKVTATILSHGKEKKIKIFKKKRRKRYNVLKGHRQEYTELRIDQIGTGKESKKSSVAAQDKAIKGTVPEQEKKKATPSKKTTAKATSDTGGKTQKASSVTKTRSQKASTTKVAKQKKESRPKAGNQTKTTKSADKKKD